MSADSPTPEADETKPKKRKPPSPPIEIPLKEERESREHLNLFRVSEEVSLNSKLRFCVFPAAEGKGWVLRLYHDPAE